MSKNIHQCFGRPGVSIAEYVLIGALVLLISIPVLMNFSTDLNHTFQGLLGLINGHSASAEQYRTTMLQQEALAKAAADGNWDAIIDTGYSGPKVDGNKTLGPAKPGTTRICMDGGFCLDLPSADDSKTPPMTLGARGNEFVAAYIQTLDDIAKQINATAGMDDTLKQLITNLANGGHSLANMQNTAENYFSSDNNTRSNISSQLSGAQDNFWAAKGALDAYLQSNPGALPTALKAVISSGADSVDQVVAVVRDKLTPLDYTTVKYRQVHDVYTGNTWNEQIGADGTSIPPTVELAAKLSEVSANGICGSGGYRNRCTRALYQQDPTPPVIETATVTYENGEAGQTSDRFLQQNKAKDMDLADQAEIVEYVTVDSTPDATAKQQCVNAGQYWIWNGGWSCSSVPPASGAPPSDPVQCTAAGGQWFSSGDSAGSCRMGDGGGGSGGGE